MSTTTLTYTGKLVATTCWCGIHHAVPPYATMYWEHENSRAFPEELTGGIPLRWATPMAGDGR